MASFLSEKDTLIKGPVGYSFVPEPKKPKPPADKYKYKQTEVQQFHHGGAYAAPAPRHYHGGAAHSHQYGGAHYHGVHSYWPPNHRGAPDHGGRYLGAHHQLAAHPLLQPRAFAHGVERIVEKPIEYRYELPAREVFVYPEPRERVLEVVREKPVVRKVVCEFYRGDGSADEAGFRHWAAVNRARVGA